MSSGYFVNCVLELYRMAAQNLSVKLDGNNLVLGICSVMGGRLSGSGYFADASWDAEDVIGQIDTAVSEGTVTHRVVLGFDGHAFVSEEDYARIASVLKDEEVLVLAVNGRTASMDLTAYGITVIDLTGMLSEHPEYMMPDGIHLSDEGNTAAAEMIEKILWE